MAQRKKKGMVHKVTLEEVKKLSRGAPVVVADGESDFYDIALFIEYDEVADKVTVIDGVLRGTQPSILRPNVAGYERTSVYTITDPMVYAEMVFQNELEAEEDS